MTMMGVQRFFESDGVVVDGEKVEIDGQTILLDDIRRVGVQAPNVALLGGLTIFAIAMGIFNLTRRQSEVPFGWHLGLLALALFGGIGLLIIMRKPRALVLVVSGGARRVLEGQDKAILHQVANAIKKAKRARQAQLQGKAP